MESRFFIVFILATSPALTSVIKEDVNLCSYKEFRCDDGQCLKSDRMCDGVTDCEDGSDETHCELGTTLLQRTKRQSRCRKSQWRCRDGGCIGFDGKCDGVVDCTDGSDETYPLCRNNKCQSNWFRCTYGACVDGTATCNGVNECADNSDEYQPHCFKESDEVQGQFKCQDGGLIPASDKCDGIANCKDGSDETVRSCAANTCPVYLFKCAYGACVDQGSDCNGKVDCADGSDESDELCNRIGSSTGTPTKPTPVIPAANKCVLPQFPDHGRYDVNLLPEAKPGQAFDTVYLTVSCEKGYGVAGESSVYCLSGTWLGKVPVCSRFCRLDDHPSVEYYCQIPGSNGGSRLCNHYEPSDTQVIPNCKSPNYYSTAVLPSMRCIDGSWDYVATCLPGLVKNGVNITILVKDKVVIYISDIKYGGQVEVQIDTDKETLKFGNRSIEIISNDTVEDEDAQNIDESDWRMAVAQPHLLVIPLRPVLNNEDNDRDVYDNVTFPDN